MMGELYHEHQWRGNESFIDAGGDPVWCLDPACNAHLTMKQLIKRGQMIERVLWKYGQGTVEAGIEIMSWVEGWDAERED